MSDEKPQLVALDFRKLRELGDGTFGFSVPRQALEDLGLVDGDGLVQDLEGRELVYEDGRIEVELDLGENDRTP